MSWEEFDETCAGCRPVILDAETKKPYPTTHPHMIMAQKEFDKLSRPEKEAWHRFTCLESRSPADLALVKKFIDAIVLNMEAQ